MDAAGPSLRVASLASMGFDNVDRSGMRVLHHDPYAPDDGLSASVDLPSLDDRGGRDYGITG